MERFEFDPNKSRSNKKLHGVDLAWAQRLWDETHLIISAKNVLGENRNLILAKVNNKCYAAIFTKRNEAIRLISCHRADRKLEKIYESRIEE
ncbi:MAG: toxin [Elusimicrobia bacterium]|nr:MAG: toxin [Elusimicrobiota bacterium]